MAVDGIMLHRIAAQLQPLIGGKIGKIQNISAEELLLPVHTKSGLKKLVVNVHSNSNRIYLAEKPVNVQPEPAAFVMYLRRWFTQAVIKDIRQAGFDRILILDLQVQTELGDQKLYRFYLEMMGKYANLVITDENDIIQELCKRIPVYENSSRLLHPGAKYTLPAQPEKLDPTGIQEDSILDRNISLTDQVSGFSPLLSKEFLYRMHQGQNFSQLLEEALGSPVLYYYDDRHFHLIELTHLEKKPQVYPLMSGLASLYRKQEETARHKEQFGDLLSLTKREISKQKKKLPRLEAALMAAQDHDKYREYGDLLFSNPPVRGKEAAVTDWNTGETVTIPLDAKMDSHANANKYYARYRKMKRSISVLEEQIEICRQDLLYFEQLQTQLDLCSWEDAQEVREELVKNRYILDRGQKRRRKKKNGAPHVTRIVLEDAVILVGKNNLQNTYLTHKLAGRNDLWFHVKDYHGSHVVLQAENESEDLIRLCAMLAAWFSKSRQSSSVPVDYTRIHQLKKVPGSKAGFVTMKSYQTIYIDPDEAMVLAALKKAK